MIKCIFDACLISNSCFVHIKGLIFMFNVYGFCHSLLKFVGVNYLNLLCSMTMDPW